MRVVGLASGGKDSCYALLKAAAHAHTVVALAHIEPPADEPDSWMYQSVASNAVPLLAEALDLPLFTRKTNASAKSRQLAYTPVEGDEVEDLVALLGDVKMAFPDLQAVCAGALWSDYQRLRVESAASRVGLLSLAPLWRREQRELLTEMLAVGVDAILVKVAGVGLQPNHLGSTLAEMQPTLEKLEALYGSHICGEGGEYETLVCNMPTFKKRLTLDDVKIVLHQQSDVAPVAYLQILSSHLEEQSSPLPLDLDALVPPIPERLLPLDESLGIRDDFLTSHSQSPHVKLVPPQGQVAVQPIFLETRQYAHVVCFSKLSGAQGVMHAATSLQDQLRDNGLGLGDILYVWLYLHSVQGSAYANANRAYCNVFGVAECIPPPARACIAMPNGEFSVTIEAIARRRRRQSGDDSRTLHVQSLSEWAPPCIGPYAQVVEDNGVTFVSGALAMHAPNASLISGTGARAQTRGCLFNIQRTLEATRTSFDQLTFYVAYVVSAHFFASVHHEFYKVVTNSNTILAVVPCDGLPKNALVEIRAVGSYKEDIPVFTCEYPCSSFASDLNQSLDCAKLFSVRHGSLVFAKVFVSSAAGSSEHVSRVFLEKLRSIADDLQILASQVYVAAKDYDALCQGCEREGRSLHVIRTRWIPGGARILSVLTLL